MQVNIETDQPVACGHHCFKDLKLSSGSSGVSTVNCSEGVYLSELIR